MLDEPARSGETTKEYIFSPDSLGRYLGLGCEYESIRSRRGKGDPIFKITRQTDYGVFILTSMANRLESGEGYKQVYSAPEISTLTGLALPNVSKILKALVRGNLLESRRGARGGYRLARDPHLITVQQMIEALNGPISLTECIETGPEECGIGSLCPLSSNWKFINDRIRVTLECITLEQMAVPGGVQLAAVSEQSKDFQEETDD